MAFADMFSAENVGNIMSDPRMQLGLALMSQSGNGTPGQIGRAGLGASQLIQQQQHQTQLQAYRQQQMAAMQQQQALQQQAAQAKQDQLHAQQQALQDPALLDQLGPMARAMAVSGGIDLASILRAQGVDNLQAHRAASLQQQQSQFDQRQARIGAGGGSSQPNGPRQRALPTLIPEHLPDGMVQDHKLNPQTGEFEPFGAPYSRYAPAKRKSNTAIDSVADEVVGADPTNSQLPGTGDLQSYMPKPQTPTGVMPMSAAGSVAAPKSPPVDDNLKAAGAAIASGKSRQAVVNRLMQAGYTAQQIQAAGI
ncbi:hypothetical protein [Pseudomonas asiatica]|uniref:hypothetical protein n=1 Tax=Pseudomonas asiatica TaxID=2219225 RepID=UPI0010C122D0|nr:hypothetical protein [Pseudomonas asiatica]